MSPVCWPQPSPDPASHTLATIKRESLCCSATGVLTPPQTLAFVTMQEHTVADAFTHTHTALTSSSLMGVRRGVEPTAPPLPGVAAGVEDTPAITAPPPRRAVRVRAPPAGPGAWGRMEAHKHS